MNSLSTDICTAAALALVATGALVYGGISSFNKKAQEKGLTEKGYSYGSVVAGSLIGFISLFGLVFYELFLKGRHER